MPSEMPTVTAMLPRQYIFVFLMRGPLPPQSAVRSNVKVEHRNPLCVRPVFRTTAADCIVAPSKAPPIPHSRAQCLVAHLASGGRAGEPRQPDMGPLSVTTEACSGVWPIINSVTWQIRERLHSTTVGDGLVCLLNMHYARIEAPQFVQRFATTQLLPSVFRSTTTQLIGKPSIPDAGFSICYAASGKHHLQCPTNRGSQSVA